MTFSTILGAVKDIVTICTSVAGLLLSAAALGVAIYGLQTWRRQLQGNSTHQVAMRVQVAAQSVKHAFSELRNNPFIPHTDPNGQFDSNRASPEAYNMAWLRLSDAVQKLRAEAFEARVLWPGLLDETVDAIGHKANELYWNLQQFLLNPNKPSKPDKMTSERWNEIKEFVFEGLTTSNGRHNRHAEDMDSLVKKIEDLTNKYVKR